LLVEPVPGNGVSHYLRDSAQCGRYANTLRTARCIT
jgi:hypothetical protein